MKFGEAVYRASSSSAGTPPPHGSDGHAGGRPEDVIDAEVVDSDSSKN